METVANGPTDGFISLDMTVKSIKPGESMTISGKDVETLIIMKSGKLSQQVKKNKADLGTGSITVMHANNKLKAKNEGSEDAVFYLMQWKGINPEKYEDISAYPDVVYVNWDTVKFNKNDKGGRRNIMRQPTPMLNEFEMHVTTLNEGISSHAPHTHLDEEIILVRYGEIEEYIGGKTFESDEGSFIFLRSMISHGVQNIGKGPCEYYAFRWIPRE
ncbi:MAG: cupin domain-containing protein [Bacteroidota bacterium]